MPSDYLETQQIRDSLSQPEGIARDGFRILANICRLVDEGDLNQPYQELILRALENREHFGSAAVILNALVRQVGLFPYLDPSELGTADGIAYEFNRPENMEDEIVFHEPQTRIYRTLLGGKSVVLSAPTSFGKSLITDAVIASGKFQNVLIVVPTIALIDETRRRLSQRFGRDYKVITHAAQELSDKNLFVLTQERVAEIDVLEKAELVVIDEFYKLAPAPGRNEDDRSERLNDVFYKAVKLKKQFYLLGPNIQGLSHEARQGFECEEFYEEYRTVVSEIHNVNPGDDPLKALTDLCKSLNDPTIIFCSSPNRAAEVAEALIQSAGTPLHTSSDAADWIAEHYHPDWHFVKALRSGIGIHHGRIPRALAHYVVSAFNNDAIRFLVCTSTLIEGVNTKARNVVIYDDKINRKSIDYFTFNNIKGRSGRMGQHFIGHVYLFHPAPTDPLPFIDIPVLSQPDSASSSLLMQVETEDLTSQSRKRLEAFLNQDFLDYSTLRANFGIAPEAQIEVAKEIAGNIGKYAPLLQWRGMPTYGQIYGVCELIWRPFRCASLGAGSAVNSRQLGVKLIQLHTAPATRGLIVSAFDYLKDADKAVQQVLDFLRLWASFHFPRLLRGLDRIQKDVFRRLDAPAGDYGLYASRIESRFFDPSLIALEEYGLPLEIAVKVGRHLRPFRNLDELLAKLRLLDAEQIDLSDFERSLTRDVQNTL